MAGLLGRCFQRTTRIRHESLTFFVGNPNKSSARSDGGGVVGVLAPFMLVPMLAFLAPHALLPTGRGALPRMSATEDRAAAKASLFSSISSFDEVRSRGGVNIDFGVKGGELDKDTRAPTNLADGGFYAVSEELGKAADDVLARVDELFPLNPTPDPTRFLGTNEGEKCPLHGCWSNIFTTAADATFSKDSERGDAKVGHPDRRPTHAHAHCPAHCPTLPPPLT